MFYVLSIISSRGVSFPVTGSTVRPRSSRVVTPRRVGVFSVAMATRDVTLLSSACTHDKL